MGTSVTPMMKQYWELKKQHPNAILFFRVGDFYEMFHDDAVLASKALEIVLTTRDKNKENAIPLCGIPYHAAAGYIHKLIKAGFSVALCEQTEDSTIAKGLVKRDVSRVITQGTLIDPELLSPKENNYIAAMAWDFKIPLPKAKEIGVAFLDLSTGAFQFFLTGSFEEAENELAKIDPRELILPQEKRPSATPHSQGEEGQTIRFLSPINFIKENAYALLKNHFQVHSVSALGEDGFGLIAAGALLAHVKETQKGVIDTITILQSYHLGEFMQIHPLAQRHLNLVPKNKEASAANRKEAEGTLLKILDYTMTAMGGRLFRRWLLHPLLSPEKIIKRQRGVAFFYENLLMRQTCHALLKKMADIERLIGRIGLNAANPRDAVALKNSLFLLPEIEKTLIVPDDTPSAIVDIQTSWDNLDDVADIIDQAITQEPPFSLKDGGVIQEGYLPELDALRRFQREGKTMLTQIELTERQRTGIESLKVRYNSVFGYYIEVNQSHLKKIPSEYIRKQTLANAERFTTIPLKEIEDHLLGAADKIVALEQNAFETIRQRLTAHTNRIQTMAGKIAALDALLSLAEAAHQNRYVCPDVNSDLTLRIIEGRHPVLDKMLSNFVPNDTLMDPPSDRLLLITGPNMAGKSTYMQQVALIVIMAQIGSFVPAANATIGVCDQIFARVGAADALTKGMSTFMVEMTEMAQILRHATSRSLILLDELGRGTSTFDGISIAWAIAEYVEELQSRTLFATHYHELTQLPLTRKGIKNYHVLIREWNDEIIFLRRVIEGGSDKSYGIEVGRLAGLPHKIISRAKEILQQLETAAGVVTPTPATHDLFASQTPSVPSPPDDLIIKALLSIDLNTMTPIQAMQFLARLIEGLLR
ncbi:MAG: DNA mismatch repair protein MutS [Nitrospirae bacterium]|nr:DNA mismatch repair protein MutS [Candidatus Troglogloeales bacterium]